MERTLNISWVSYAGHRMYIDGDPYNIKDECIYFYDVNGVAAQIKLVGGTSFGIDMKDCDFKLRTKENFTRNEVFAIKKRRDKYGNRNFPYVYVYIPISLVNFTIGKEYVEEKHHYNYFYKDYTFDVVYFNSYGGKSYDGISYNGNRLTFNICFNAEETDEEKQFLVFVGEISKTCQTSFTLHEMRKLLQYYNITKKPTSTEDKISSMTESYFSLSDADKDKFLDSIGCN